MIEYQREAHLSSGLWYFTICFYDSKNHATTSFLFKEERIATYVTSDMMNTCHVMSYFHDSEAPSMEFMLPKYTEIKGIYFLDLNRNLRMNHGNINFRIIAKRE
jgi:hypothetical protein